MKLLTCLSVLVAASLAEDAPNYLAGFYGGHGLHVGHGLVHPAFHGYGYVKPAVHVGHGYVKPAEHEVYGYAKPVAHGVYGFAKPAAHGFFGFAKPAVNPYEYGQ